MTKNKKLIILSALLFLFAFSTIFASSLLERKPSMFPIFKNGFSQQISLSSSNVGVGTYLSGYARWAKSTGWWSDEQIKNDITKQYSAFHEVGAIWGREDFSWHELEKEEGKFDWSLTGMASDLVLEQYKDGDNITVILGQTPAWASSSPNGSTDPDAFKYPDKDPNLANWKRYVSKVVSRYKHKVKYWEIWNEADIYQQTGTYFFIPKPGETREESYAKLLQTAYTTIKKIDPEANVLINSFGSWNISGDLSNPLMGDNMLEFIMMQNHIDDGLWPYFDIFNIHIYSLSDPGEEVIRAKNLLNNWQVSKNKPIFITETNPNQYLDTNPPPGLLTPGSGGNTVDNAAAIMPWWLTREIKSGADKTFWFSLLNWQCDPGCGNFSHAGLIKISDFSKQSTWSKMKSIVTGVSDSVKDASKKFE